MSDKENIERKIAGILDTETDAVKLSNALFGECGLFNKLAPTEDERRELVKLDIFRRAMAVMSNLQKAEIKRFEKDVASAERKKPPIRITVTLPRSLHAALRAESEKEGVSISELLRLKARVPYESIAGTAEYVKTK